MLATRDVRRFPSVLLAIIFALASALILGGVLGYTLKPAVHVPGPTQVLMVREPADTSTGATCIWLSGHKHC
jgi:hypothetical protein